jgi:hypothetical protein
MKSRRLIPRSPRRRGEQGRWDFEAERLGGFQVDHQLAFRRRLDRQGRASRRRHLHARELLGREAVDLALDREQCIDALDRLDRVTGAFCSRAKSKNLRRPCAQQAASMIAPPLRVAS